MGRREVPGELICPAQGWLDGEWQRAEGGPNSNGDEAGELHGNHEGVWERVGFDRREHNVWDWPLSYKP